MPDPSDQPLAPGPHEPPADAGTGRPAATAARGQRGPGALTVALESLALTSTGAVVDGLLSGELGLWFALGFVAASLLTAVTVRRDDLLAGVILPPLVFAASVVLTSPVIPGGSGGGLRRQLLELAGVLALQSPLLVGTTAAAGLVTLVRWRRGAAAEPEEPQPAHPADGDGQDVDEA